MSTARASVCSILVGFVLLGSLCALAQDWPQWRGANRDGKVTGFTPPDKWPQELTQKWKVAVGAGDSTPALVGGKLYSFSRQGEEEVTLCLDAETGKEIWRDKYAAQSVGGPASRHPGPRSSPAVGEGRVVTLGVGGVLSCLDAATGEVKWRNDPFPQVVPRFFTSMSPLIVDGTVIAHLGGPGNGALIAYDLATGNEKWKWADEGPEYASPVVLMVDGSKQIVTLTEKSIVGIGLADGKLLWQRPFVPERRAYNAATPIVNGQTVIYTGAARGTTAIKIGKEGDGFVAKELWVNPDLAPQFNTPVLENGMLYGLTSTGNLFCINAENGQTVWTDTTERDKGGFTAMVDAGSVLMALPSSSELLVFKPSDKAYEEVARIKVADMPTYAHPVIAGKQLFVKDQESLTALSLQ